MLRVNKQYSIVIILAFLISACAAETQKVMPKPDEIVHVQQKSSDIIIDYNPMVDILFVLDNSKSMSGELRYLKKNIPQFVKEISGNTLVDYHIGVTYVHDSVRYTNQDGGVLKTNPNTGEIQYLENGELIQPKSGGSNFIHQGNFDDLKSLFNIQTPYVSKNIWSEEKDGTRKLVTAAVGPEIEESFSPVTAALFNRDRLATTNKNFYRDDSHLVVVFVTDAEDSSSIEPSQLYDDLLELKAGDASKISAYAVLCKEGDNRCLTLKNSGGTIESHATRIKEFVNLAYDEKVKAAKKSNKKNVQMLNPILNLRSNSWGKQLAKIGSEIKKQTLEKKIKLQAIPEYDLALEQPKIKVNIDGVEIPRNEPHGWTYNVQENTVTIHSEIQVVEMTSDSQISIELTKLNANEFAKEVE